MDDNNTISEIEEEIHPLEEMFREFSRIRNIIDKEEQDNAFKEFHEKYPTYPVIY